MNPSRLELSEDCENVYAVLARGGLALVPTDIGYGLVACSESAVARIYELKGRPSEKPCVTVATRAVLRDVALLQDERLRGWIERTSATTPLAVINRVRPQSALLQNLAPGVLSQATSNGTIATFHNAGALLTRLAERALLDGRLVVGSSANVSRTGNNYRLEEVPESIRSRVDLTLDRGPARYENPGRLATTIIDLTTYRFHRKGINHDFIAAAWEEMRAELESSSDALRSGAR